ncbi:MAG: hypothetical protein Q9218_006001 [Villophora microphyllina]
MVLAVDLLNPTPQAEARKHKLKTLVPAPRSFFMDVKCPGCFTITTVFSHAQTVVTCGGCSTVLCQPLIVLKYWWQSPSYGRLFIQEEIDECITSGLWAICTTQIRCSGHNRWSKIKHDKVKEDAVRSKERSQLSRNIQDAVKKNGENPDTNGELSTILAQAKKAGLPKDVIERAVAKGRGLSLSGEPLQTVTLEAMLPPSVSAIIECQTDNKTRTLNDLRLIVKNIGGRVTATSHLFERRGHIILDSDVLLEEEDVLEKIFETEAVDYEFEEGELSLSVYTEPDKTTSIAQTLSDSLDLKIRSYDMTWVPRPESLVEVEGTKDTGQMPLDEIISQIEADPSVQAVYHNAALD